MFAGSVSKPSPSTVSPRARASARARWPGVGLRGVRGMSMAIQTAPQGDRFQGRTECKMRFPLGRRSLGSVGHQHRKARNDVAEKPKGMKLLKAALSTRKSASMLAFGFSSGLPFALLIGTLNAWLGEVGINLATIGVLSWIGLTYSFKFLWSPAVDRLEIPGVARLGRRKSWILSCQLVLIASFVALGLTDPVTNIGWFAIFAFLGAFASATQDVAVDAWR